jgi:hypothetical protein
MIETARIERFVKAGPVIAKSKDDEPGSGNDVIGGPSSRHSKPRPPGSRRDGPAAPLSSKRRIAVDVYPIGCLRWNVAALALGRPT